MDITTQEGERFRSLYKKPNDPANDCYLWKGCLDKDGYGTFYFRKKNRRAHRVGYFMFYGPIDDDMVIDHKCKNRSCVNPTHLRPVTKTQNALENTKSVAALNRLKKTCPKGHKYDRKYGKQRYCSICQAEKSKRLRKVWLEEANKIKC